jgi:hypothetical protein
MNADGTLKLLVSMMGSLPVCVGGGGAMMWAGRNLLDGVQVCKHMCVYAGHAVCSVDAHAHTHVYAYTRIVGKHVQAGS